MGTKIGLIPLIMIIFVSFPVVFGDDAGGITVTPDKESYETGELLFISGHVEEKKMPILALRIFDPEDSILSANNVEIEDDNSFSKMVSLDSPFYDKPGVYTIKIDYGKLDKEITFEIKSDIASEETSIVEPEEIIPELTSIETDKKIYTDNDTITITGTVNTIDEATVLIGIHDPFGIPTGFYFGEIDSNNEFSTSFLAKAGINFKIDGTYTVLAHYGESKKEASFDFVKSIPTQVVEEIEKQEPLEITEEEKEEQKPTEIVEEEQSPQSKMVEEIDETKPTKIIEKEKKSSISVVKEPIPETKELPIIEKQLPKTTQEKEPIKEDNLSVEDIELGILLNQISLNCDQNDYVDTVSYYDGMGPALIRLCKYSDAIAFFDKELAADPHNVQSLTNKGAALAKLGHFEEAIIHYDHALEINPTFVPALNNKANALSQLWKFDEAIEIYKIAKSLEPANHIINNNLALSESRFIPLDENQKPIFEPSVQNIQNEKIENTEIKSQKNLEKADLFEQIESIFSSIGSIFGLQ
ncbi:MAG TPA: tetratricopeptide repeat protein [Nitrosopumilaceae archaeon]|nr:tetratricopeptide repeat protein [Nitrosopumilaceae archaeon]